MSPVRNHFKLFLNKVNVKHIVLVMLLVFLGILVWTSFVLADSCPSIPQLPAPLLILWAK